jgi:hypothetical protein
LGKLLEGERQPGKTRRKNRKWNPIWEKMEKIQKIAITINKKWIIRINTLNTTL